MKKYLVLFALLTSAAFSEELPTLFGLPVGVSTGEFFNAWSATDFPIDFIVNGRGVANLYIIKGHPVLSKELSGEFQRLSTSISLHRNRNNFLFTNEAARSKIQRDLHICEQHISIVYTNEEASKQEVATLETRLRKNFPTWEVCSNKNENFKMIGPSGWTVDCARKATDNVKAPYVLSITYAEPDDTPPESKNKLSPDQLDEFFKASKDARQKYLQEHAENFKLVAADYDPQSKSFRSATMKRHGAELLAQLVTSGDTGLKDGNLPKNNPKDSQLAFANGIEKYATDQDIFVFCSGFSFGTNGIPDDIRAMNKDWNPYQWMLIMQKIGSEIKKNKIADEAPAPVR